MFIRKKCAKTIHITYIIAIFLLKNIHTEKFVCIINLTNDDKLKKLTIEILILPCLLF